MSSIFTRLRHSLAKSSLSLAAVALGFVFAAILIAIQGKNPWDAAMAIFHGSLDGKYAIGRTLEKATPLIFTGLAVTVALKAGLFNIGAQGQVVAGAVVGAYTGYAFHLPSAIHIPVALLFGAMAGAVPAAIAGTLKVTRNVHEVISTIMLNTIVVSIAEYLCSPRGPWTKKGAGFPRTPEIQSTARIPHFWDLPLGFVFALMAVVAIWYLLAKTTIGFEFATVGANKHAAQYAGMSVNTVTVGAMTMAGMLAGIGGASQAIGITGYFIPSGVSGLGFDGITIALLAKLNPKSTIPAALLIGAMRASNTALQADAKIAPEIIDVIVAIMLLMVAAPVVVRTILRIKSQPGQELQLTAGWGS